MSPVLTETLLDTTAREGRALLTAVRSDPEAEIEACPGWDATRLLGHVGEVHRFVTRIVISRAAERPAGEPTDRPPTDTEPWDWYAEGLAALVKALGSVEPTTKMWSWSDRRDAGFYQRRMAHETTIHRFDAEAATGGAAHIDSQLATDGVNEVLAVGMRYRSDGPAPEYPDSSMLLVRSDGAERWLVRSVDGTLLIAHNGDAGHRADVVVTGPAEDLYLHLWGRRSPTLTISGDADAAAAWGAVAP
jgi:uncharacterized protein (TIGR03083 family)